MIKCCLGNKSTKKNVIPTSVSKFVNSNQLFDNIDFTENHFSRIFLGNGVSSFTYKIKLNKTEYTCKKIEKDYKDDVINEVMVLKKIKGEINLPYIYKAIETPNNYFILYKHIPEKDLEQYVTSVEKLKPKKIAIITNEILKGLEALFLHNFVHLDIKLENIIIKEKDTIKITLIDLAFCKKLNNNNKLEHLSGTIGYCPPELMLYERYGYNSDIWSLGVVIYNLFTKYNLFTSKRKKYIEELLQFENIYKFKRAQLDLVDKDALDLIDKMLRKIPFTRYSIKQIKNHKFIKSNVDDY